MELPAPLAVLPAPLLVLPDVPLCALPGVLRDDPDAPVLDAPLEVEPAPEPVLAPLLLPLDPLSPDESRAFASTNCSPPDICDVPCEPGLALVVPPAVDPLAVEPAPLLVLPDVALVPLAPLVRLDVLEVEPLADICIKQPVAVILPRPPLVPVWPVLPAPDCACPNATVAQIAITAAPPVKSCRFMFPSSSTPSDDAARLVGRACCVRPVVQARYQHAPRRRVTRRCVPHDLPLSSPGRRLP